MRSCDRDARAQTAGGTPTHIPVQPPSRRTELTRRGTADWRYRGADQDPLGTGCQRRGASLAPPKRADSAQAGNGRTLRRPLNPFSAGFRLRRIQIGAIELELVTTQALRFIHGGIGVANERIDILTIARKQADANAGRSVQLQIAHSVRLR